MSSRLLEELEASPEAFVSREGAEAGQPVPHRGDSGIPGSSIPSSGIPGSGIPAGDPRLSDAVLVVPALLAQEANGETPGSPEPGFAAVDDAPDTVRRRIEPGPEAVGERVAAMRNAPEPGAEPEPSPQAATAHEEAPREGEGAVEPAALASQAPEAPEGLDLQVEFFPDLPAEELTVVVPAVSDTRELSHRLEATPEPASLAPTASFAAVLPAAVLPAAVLPAEAVSAEAGSAEAEPSVSVAQSLVAEPPVLEGQATESEATSVVPALDVAALEEAATAAAGELELPELEDPDDGEEVPVGWIEQGSEPPPPAEPEAEGAGEVPAGWIEQGAEEQANGELAADALPGRSSTPWVDEEAEPVTPADRGRAVPPQNADLPLAEELRGRVLANRFLAEEILEQSLTSITYSAYHLALDSPVMVQILPRGLATTPETCELVRRTAVAASMIGSPHIVRALDFGVFGGGWPYWVAEHFDGKSLARILAEDGRLPLRRVLALGKQLALGLAAAHGAGIVHGHLKPDCLLVVDAGARSEVARILGFGLLQVSAGQAAPPSSALFGVPFYVSPEQAACRPCDERSDLYALGAVLYELMTGTPPFVGGDFAAVLCQHLDDEPEPPSTRLNSNPSLSRSMDAVVLRCLAKNPEERYANAGELAEVLARLEQSVGSSRRRPMPEVARPTATIHTPPPRSDSNTPPGPKVIVREDVDAELLPAAATPPSPAAPVLPDPSTLPMPLPEDADATRQVAAVGRNLPERAAGGSPQRGDADATKSGKAKRGLFEQIRDAVQRLGREAKGE